MTLSAVEQVVAKINPAPASPTTACESLAGLGHPESHCHSRELLWVPVGCSIPGNFHRAPRVEQECSHSRLEQCPHPLDSLTGATPCNILSAAVIISDCINRLINY